MPGGASLAGVEFSLCAIRAQMSSSWCGTDLLRDIDLVISDVRKLMPEHDRRVI